MSDQPSEKKLPPGDMGLPLLGETLPFAKNPFGFIDERLISHGRTFRTSVLGRKSVVIAGPDAAGQFIDTNDVTRKDSMPPHIQELFGGQSLPLLDGDEHRQRKLAVMRGFTRVALASYIPILQTATEQAFERWTAAGEFTWLPELKRISIEAICTTVIGMKPGAEMDQLCRDYELVTDGFATLPIKLPGTAFSKALEARDRILGVLAGHVRARRQAPTQDGLSRILVPEAGGPSISDEHAVLELHHIVIAGYIVFAELAEIVRRLHDHPGVRRRLAQEIAQLAPAALTLEALTAMPYLLQVVNEIKRLCPVVPAIFGRARHTFSFDGYTIPSGWMVMWAVTPSHNAQGVYTNPELFDPDRFSPERAEDQRHEHAFAPQGAGAPTGHKCPGLDFSTYFMELFTVILVRGYAYDLRANHHELSFAKTPPEPSDGLRATVRRDPGAGAA
ncbi:MAG: cytochrome P450 [Candidatus Eisenbacteria bacterium]|nr:cytochrome P450 [Candidatus Eisenbacteria bacterium]